MRIPTVLVAVAAILSSGCSTLTPGERHAAVVIGTVVLAGAIGAYASHSSDDAARWTPGRGPGPAIRP